MKATIPTSGHDLRVASTAAGIVQAIRENECDTTSPYLSDGLAVQLLEAFVENEVERRSKPAGDGPSASDAIGALAAMANPHIIVGDGNRCLCGTYDGKPVSCRDVLAGRALVKDCGL